MFASRIAREKATVPSRNNQRGGPRRNAAVEPHDLLGGRGKALPESLRTVMGSRMGFDFSRVRVHADAEGRSTARAMGARGWTFGEHIVLGERADAHTLAHELAHVVQQSGAGGAGSRSEDGALERDADAAALYGQRPQLSAPSPGIQMQPEDDDQYRLRRPSILKDYPDEDQFKLKTTWPGKKKERRFGQAAKPAPLEMQLTPLDRQRIDDFLLEHGFHLQEGEIAGVGEPVLDGRVTSMPEIAEMVAPMVMQGVGKDKIRVYLANIYMKELLALTHKGSVKPLGSMQFSLPVQPEPAAPAHKTPGKIQGRQTALGAGVQVAWHASVKTGRPASTPMDTTIQFQAGQVYVAHADKESGSEPQAMIQVGYNVTTHQYTLLTGGQFTEVISLFNGLLQVSEFVQLLAGMAFGGGGSVSGQIQPSFGGQAMVQVGPVQLGATFFTGATVVPGGESTFDTGGGLVIQGNF
jgi:hypothetical protein